MTLTRLYEPPGSQCFVCAPANPSGLRIPFAYDEDDATVRAEVTFGELHCGAPTYVHAGLTMAVLAEAMAWSIVASTGRFAITVGTEVDFARPMRANTLYLTVARVEEVSGSVIRAAATFHEPGGELTAIARGRFHAVSEQAADRLRTRVNRAAPTTGPGRP